MDNPLDYTLNAKSTNGMTKKCRVCGDKALAFNFNGLSCESCKELICLQGGSCFIDMSTRKFCPNCRLNKCFAIGMKKELVMAREEKSKRKRANNQNNELEFGLEAAPSPASSEDKFEVENHTFDLSTYEQARFDEIKRASMVFLHKPYCVLQLTSEANLLQTLTLQETYIKKIIEFCKSIEAFHCMKAEDQLNMVKGFFEDSLTIRCAYHYDFEQDGFPVQTNEFAQSALFVRLDIIFPPEQKQHQDPYRKYIIGLHNEIDNDKNIRDLLIVMSLFKPKSDVSCPEFIRYHFFVYCRLLLRYLEMKYQNEEKASIKYLRLMTFIEQMYQMKELIYETYMDIDIGLVSHVLAEIYHLHRTQSVIMEA